MRTELKTVRGQLVECLGELGWLKREVASAAGAAEEAARGVQAQWREAGEERARDQAELSAAIEERSALRAARDELQAALERATSELAEAKAELAEARARLEGDRQRHEEQSRRLERENERLSRAAGRNRAVCPVGGRRPVCPPGASQGLAPPPLSGAPAARAAPQSAG